MKDLSIPIIKKLNLAYVGTIIKANLNLLIIFELDLMLNKVKIKFL